MSNVEGLVTLQERMVNLVNQMTIPVVEVAIVIESHINQLLPKLIEYSQKNSWYMRLEFFTQFLVLEKFPVLETLTFLD